MTSSKDMTEAIKKLNKGLDIFGGDRETMLNYVSKIADSIECIANVMKEAHEMKCKQQVKP